DHPGVAADPAAPVAETRGTEAKAARIASRATRGATRLVTYPPLPLRCNPFLPGTRRSGLADRDARRRTQTRRIRDRRHCARPGWAGPHHSAPGPASGAAGQPVARGGRRASTTETTSTQIRTTRIGKNTNSATAAAAAT